MFGVQKSKLEAIKVVSLVKKKKKKIAESVSIPILLILTFTSAFLLEVITLVPFTLGSGNCSMILSETLTFTSVLELPLGHALE